MINYCKVEAAADTLNEDGATLVKLTDKMDKTYTGVMNPEDTMGLIYQLLATMDAHNPERAEGALLTTIIKGTLERLRDPKNVAKGGWSELTLTQCSKNVFEEISEFRQACMWVKYGGEETRVSEGRDVLAAMGMFLQKMEGPRDGK